MLLELAGARVERLDPARVAAAERPVAAIVLRPGAAITEAKVMAHLSAHIAKFKLPRRIVLVHALPKNALGKVVKAELRARL